MINTLPSLRQHWQSLLLLLFAAFVITPFALLCFYAHPSADDWYMAAAGRDLGVIGASVKWYQEMTGRIVQQGITSLHPIRLGVWACHLWCLGYLIGLGAGLHSLISRRLPELDRARRAGFIALALMLYLWVMRSPSQGLYWINGGNTYLLAGILQLHLFARLGPADLRLGTAAPVILLALAAAWCSELAMGLQFLSLILLGVWHWLEHRQPHRLVIAALIATTLAVAVIFLSPGNDWRAGEYHGAAQGRLIPSLILGGKLAISHLVAWLTFAPFFLLFLLLLAGWPVLAEKNPRRAWLLLALALVMIVGTTWGGFFIGAWSMGQSIPPRAVNLLCLFFVIEWGVLLAAVSAVLHAHGWARPAITPATFLLLLLALTATLRAPNNVKNAWRDLLSGDAAKFDRECQRRYTLIRDSAEAEVTVPPLRVQPVSLFFNDLKPDAADWRNVGMAEFFHKKAIHLAAP